MKCIDPAAPEEALLKILRRDKVSSLLRGPPESRTKLHEQSHHSGIKANSTSPI